MSPSPALSNPAGSHRIIVIVLAGFALGYAWFSMTSISRHDSWYRNTDMNIHNMVDALAINSDISPNPFAQPGVPLKYLLALDYRIRHELGLLPVWNMRTFGKSPEPLREISKLIHIQHLHSRILVVMLILAAGSFAYAVTRHMDAACLAVILLCGCAGLLFHGLLTRPELLCVGFGNILALLCVWRAAALDPGKNKYIWLTLAGLLCGLSMLEKLPGIFYVVVCYGWCWLAAFLPRRNPNRALSAAPTFRSGWLAAAAAGGVLWLLFALGNFHDALGDVVLLRLRVAAVFIGLLPFMSLVCTSSPRGFFWGERTRELALIGGGVLAVFPLSYLLLRGMMSEAQAAKYMTGILHFLVNPAPYMDGLLATKPDLAHEFGNFLKESPVLFAAAVILTITLCASRAAPGRLKAFVGLLLLTALSMALLMSGRHYYAQYSIFFQVPLVLVSALSLHGLNLMRPTAGSAGKPHWTAPLVISAAAMLVFPVWSDTQSKFYFYQDDATLPVKPLTVTFIFDHDAHVLEYRQIMSRRYGSREEFSKFLDQYLSNPSNRH